MAKAMRCITVKAAERSPKTGAFEPFPATFRGELTDPFLLCDEVGPMESEGPPSDPDEFGVDWHPVCGVDVMTYLTQGVGRHADSFGTREQFQAPGMHWIRTGYGVERAEGAATPRGAVTHGFQVWVNVPGANKLDVPAWGTECDKELPDLQPEDGVHLRLLAGSIRTARGPFATIQPVLIFDLYVIAPSVTYTHYVPREFDTCIVYLYRGSAVVGTDDVPLRHVALLDATDPARRDLVITAGPEGAGAMVFAGKRLNQPIAWKGSFVMTSPEELIELYDSLNRGEFPPARVPWDYRRASARPDDYDGGEDAAGPAAQ